MQLFAGDDAAARMMDGFGLPTTALPAPPWDQAIVVLGDPTALRRLRGWRCGGSRHRVLVLGSAPCAKLWALEPVEVVTDPIRAHVLGAMERLARRGVAHRIFMDHGIADLSTLEFLGRSGERRTLTRTERGLLAFLGSQPGQEVSRESLAEQVWGKRGGRAAFRAIVAAVSRLRQKIEATPSHPRSLLRGPRGGYVLVAHHPAAPATPVTPFIDRPGLLARLREIAEQASAVLAGPPGAGKTRLAMAWASERPAGDVVWVEAEHARSVSDVLHRMARSLGASGHPDALRERLMAWNVRHVVLDGADELTEDALRSLVEGCSPLKLVVTRQALVDGIQTIPVGPLTSDQTQSMIRARGGASDEQPPRLPLEIELGGEPSRAAARAVERLDAPSKRALERAATFAGRFTADAYQAAFDRPPEDLFALSRRNLLQQVGGGFRILQCVRDSTPIRPADRLTHAVWVARCAERHWPAILTDDARQPLEALGSIEADVFHAFEQVYATEPGLAARLAPTCRTLLRSSSDFAGLDRLAQRLDGTETPEALWVRGQHWVNLDRPRALDLLERCEQATDGWMAASARLSRAGATAWDQGPDAALALLEPWPYPRPRALSLGAAALAVVMRRNRIGYAAMARRLEPIVNALHRNGHRIQALDAAVWLQLAHHYNGDSARALRLSKKHASWLAAAPHPALACVSDSNASVFANALGERSLALQLQRRAQRVGGGDRRARRSQLMLGLLLLEAGRLDEARAELDSFASWARSREQRQDESQARELLAMVLLELGRVDRATWEAEVALAKVRRPAERAGPLLALATATWERDPGSAQELLAQICTVGMTARRRVETAARAFAMTGNPTWRERLDELEATMASAEGLRESLHLLRTGQRPENAGYAVRATARILASGR